MIKKFLVSFVIGISIVFLSAYYFTSSPAPRIHGQYYLTSYSSTILRVQASSSEENSYQTLSTSLFPLALFLLASVLLVLLYRISLQRIFQRLSQNLQRQSEEISQELQRISQEFLRDLQRQSERISRILRRLSEKKKSRRKPAEKILEGSIPVNPEALALKVAKQIDLEINMHFANDVEGAVVFLQKLIERLKDCLKKLQ